MIKCPINIKLFMGHFLLTKGEFVKIKFIEIIKYISLFFGIILLFNLFLLIVCLIPSSSIEKKVKDSSKILLEEGLLFTLPYSSNVQNNNMTDSIIINEAYSIDNEKPVESYLTMRKNYNKDYTITELKDVSGEGISFISGDIKGIGETFDPVNELSDFLDGNVHTSLEYGKYWHGYMVLYRPLLALFDISQIRILQLVIFVILLITFLILVYKRLGLGFSLIFLYSFLFYDYFHVSYSLESGPIFMVTMVSTIILLIRIDKIKNIAKYIFVVACITNYVDFLTVPLITLATPLTIYVLYAQKNNNLNFKEIFILIFKSVVAWCVGYALTWFMKWLLFDIILNGNLIKTAITQVLYRSSRENYYSKYNIFELIGSFLKPYIFILIISIVILLIKRPKRNEIINVVPLIITGAMPVVWTFVFANHSLLHSFFTYRHMIILMYSSLSLIYLIIKDEKIMLKKGSK